MPIRLTVVAGPHLGRTFTFAGHDAFLVGRSKRAHFRLPRQDKYFSRVHFLVELNPPQCCLLDMGSLNGTSINGRPVPPGEKAPLGDGDRIEGGDTVLAVAVTPGEPDAVTTDELAAPEPAAAPLPSAAAVRRPDAAGRCAACAAPAAGLLCPECEGQARGQTRPVAGYRVVREIGRGGMGVVSLAVREADGLRVALKTIAPAVAGTREQVARFLREAQVLRRLDHPRVVAFRDVGVSGGLLYFAMDYVEGKDAGRLLTAHGPLPPGRAVAWTLQLLEALAYAHGRGFVHRDVKPANVLITAEHGREAVRLADFGLARVYAASQLSGLTMAGEVGGTPAFMAPEQVTHFREARPASDQYSAAAMLYNLLTNRYLFDFPAPHHERLALVVEGEPVPILKRRPDLPAKLAAVIHRALAKEPKKRFADVKAFAKALLPFRGPAAAPAAPGSTVSFGG